MVYRVKRSRKYRPFWKKRYHRRWWRRRHRHFHPRRFRKRQVVTVRKPRKWVTVYFRGWEPCGIVGAHYTRDKDGKISVGEAVKNNWESTWGSNYLTTSPNNTQYKDFIGGYGMSTLNLNGLVQRCERGLAESSHDISNFTNGRWVSGRFYPIKLHDLDWVIYFDTHFSKTDTDYQNRKKWLNPLHLLLKPGKTYVPQWKKSPGRPWVRKKKLPAVNLENEFVDKTWLNNVALLSYYFSVIDIENPIGEPEAKETTTGGLRNDWFKCKCYTWKDRTKWDNKFTQQNKTDWTEWFNQFWQDHIIGQGSDKRPRQAPFLPPFSKSERLQCMSFLYEMKFQFTGNTFGVSGPGSAGKEVNTPTECNGSCPTCISRKDLNKHGWIKKRKFRELTEANNQDYIHPKPRKKEKKKTFTSKEDLYRYIENVCKKY